MGGTPVVVVVVHEDARVVDDLRTRLSACGLLVEGFTELQPAIDRVGAGGIGAVIAGWDPRLGREVYRWCYERRDDVRQRFVFVVDEIAPSRLGEARRRRILPRGNPAAIVVVAIAVIRGEPTGPRLLLVEEDPVEREVIAGLLAADGFVVRCATQEAPASTQLAADAVDVVVWDWPGNGDAATELHRCLTTYGAELMSRLVFVTGGDPTAVKRYAGTVPVIPKGQDSPTLFEQLYQIASGMRLAQGTPPTGVATIDAPATTPRRVSASTPPPIPQHVRDVATARHRRGN